MSEQTKLKVKSINLIKIGDEFSWDTIGGKCYQGVIVDIDSNVAYVKCTDGVTRPVEI